MPKLTDTRKEQNIVARVQATLDESGEWLSVADAAKHFDIPIATLAQAVREKRVPALASTNPGD